MSKQVDAAKARRDEALSTLYVTWPLTGELVQRYSDDIHSEMQQAIIAEFHAEMLALVAEAQQARANAESVLQRRTSSLAWLADAELIRANALAPFVVQDIAALGGDVDALAAFVRDALASDDRVLQWLVLRHADQAFAGVDNETLTPRNVMTWQQARDDLRQVVAPPELLDAERRAREMLLKADDIQRAAAWELPETKQEYAAKYSLPLSALPDTLAVPD
jgi:hypothetical protein